MNAFGITKPIWGHTHKINSKYYYDFFLYFYFCSVYNTQISHISQMICFLKFHEYNSTFFMERT